MTRHVLKGCILLVAINFCLLASSLHAYPTSMYWGCYECVERSRLMVFADDYCLFVKDGGEGWTKCSEMTIGEQTFCDLMGDACYNVDVNGGGGSGGSVCAPIAHNIYSDLLKIEAGKFGENLARAN